MRSITYNVLEYHEFDALVNEHIPSAHGEYEFVAMEEANNDSSYTYQGIEPMDIADESTKKYELGEILDGKLMNKVGAVLEYLCYLKVIEPGNYLIEVCW